jgi:ribosomal peptide maturation radical SAM protein 1
VFPELVRRLLAGESPHGLPGIFARGVPSPLGDRTHAPMVLDLDRLPYPDFEDYFTQFHASGLAAIETPTLPIETSRGCWWGQKHHCTFCGLNGEGMPYRRKSPRRALDEIDVLSTRYPARSFYATDNILDLEYFDTVLRELADRPRPPRLYYMMKSNLSRTQLRLLARSGFWGIYAGIESLSTPILRLMKKGVTGLHNVRLLKWAAEIGVAADWAFLAGFPGEDPGEYQRIAELIPSLTHLRPPGGLYQIRVDRFSPYFTAPEAGGLANVRAGIAYQHVYPFPSADLDRLAYYFDYEYVDGRDPPKYTLAVQDAIEQWRGHYGAARLELRLEDDRLEIEDTRPSASRPTTVLRGPARLAYLALDAGTTCTAVSAALREGLAGDAPDEAQIERWLQDWLDARLVMREGSRYLSLATSVAERVQLPVDRFLAQLVEQAS